MAVRKKTAATNGHATRLNGHANGAAVPLVEDAPAPTLIVIPKPHVINLRFRIRGITPLVMCRFDQKVRNEMEAKTEGRARLKKQPKNPEEEFNAARWLSTDGWDGIHAAGIRAAVISAARSVEGLTMTSLKQGVFIRADGYSDDHTPLVKIIGKPKKYSAMCRTTTGVAYPRHRPMYQPWEAVVNMQVNGHLLSAEAAANLLSLAGQFCGLGEWRPTAPKSMTGDFGRFEIVEDIGR